MATVIGDKLKFFKKTFKKELDAVSLNTFADDFWEVVKDYPDRPDGLTKEKVEQTVGRWHLDEPNNKKSKPTQNVALVYANLLVFYLEKKIPGIKLERNLFTGKTALNIFEEQVEEVKNNRRDNVPNPEDRYMIDIGLKWKDVDLEMWQEELEQFAGLWILYRHNFNKILTARARPVLRKLLYIFNSGEQGKYSFKQYNHIDKDSGVALFHAGSVVMKGEVVSFFGSEQTGNRMRALFFLKEARPRRNFECKTGRMLAFSFMDQEPCHAKFIIMRHMKPDDEGFPDNVDLYAEDIVNQYHPLNTREKKYKNINMPKEDILNVDFGDKTSNEFVRDYISNELKTDYSADVTRTRNFNREWQNIGLHDNWKIVKNSNLKTRGR